MAHAVACGPQPCSHQLWSALWCLEFKLPPRAGATLILRVCPSTHPELISCLGHQMAPRFHGSRRTVAAEREDFPPWHCPSAHPAWVGFQPPAALCRESQDSQNVWGAPLFQALSFCHLGLELSPPHISTGCINYLAHEGAASLCPGGDGTGTQGLSRTLWWLSARDVQGSMKSPALLLKYCP